MPATARRLIRKMRGGAQAHLLEADDGNFYVVKFRNNPQGRRVLINEWIGAIFLRHLGIACPPVAIVRIDSSFIQANADLGLQFGGSQVQVEPGWHFGSKFPGDPARMAVYDFVPDALLQRVENIHEFAAMLAFDKWAGNSDARQCIFIRARVRDHAPTAGVHPLRVGFVALMVDHGYLFNGPWWDYPDAASMGLYFRPVVYRTVRNLESFQPVLDRILNFPEEVVDDALRELPPEWLNGDADNLNALLERLMARRSRVPDLLRQCSRHVASSFPNWSER